MKNRNHGFTLIELLLVIAIIGILAAIAMPFYQGHVLRARLTEVENTMTVLKSAVTAYHHDTETFPSCPSVVEIRTSLGVGVESVTRISAMTIVDGAITAWVQNVDPLVDGKTIILTPTDAGDGSLSWAWDTSADFPVHLKPRS